MLHLPRTLKQKNSNALKLLLRPRLDAFRVNFVNERKVATSFPLILIKTSSLFLSKKCCCCSCSDVVVIIVVVVHLVLMLLLLLLLSCSCFCCIAGQFNNRRLRKGPNGTTPINWFFMVITNSCKLKLRKVRSTRRLANTLSKRVFYLVRKSKQIIQVFGRRYEIN